MIEEKSKSKKNRPRTFYRYSECFKEKVIEEVSQGSSISEVCRRYDIKRNRYGSKMDKKIWSARVVKHNNTS